MSVAVAFAVLLVAATAERLLYSLFKNVLPTVRLFIHYRRRNAAGIANTYRGGRRKEGERVWVKSI